MKRRIMACLLAACMCGTGGCSLPAGEGDSPCPVWANSQWKGKRVAFLGDSITDKKHVGTTKCYWEYLAEMLGLLPRVYGINGNQMNGVLKQAERLLAEQGDSIDVIFIFAGTNDFNAGVPVGEWFAESEVETQVKGGGMERRKHREPVLDEATFKGRINSVMAYLKANYPTKQVILLTPIHRAAARFANNNIQPDEHFANKVGEYVERYVEAVKEAANVWAVPVIDLNSLSGLYPLEDAHARYFHDPQTDRLHPNAEGHRRMALALAYAMQALPASFE